MIYKLDLPTRAFEAIKAGTKKVEGRTITSKSKEFISKIVPGDTIEFTNLDTKETLITSVNFMHHYKDVNEMLIKEGVENVLSSFPKTIEHGIGSYNSFEGYKEAIEKRGIYAIGILI